MPDYVWWQDQDELRRLNQRFGVGPLHLHQPARDRDQGERLEDLDYVTSQSRAARRRARRHAPPTSRSRSARASRWSAAARSARSEYNLDEAAGDLFEQLDREDRALPRGPALVSDRDALALTGTWGQTATDFAGADENRDNSGDVGRSALDWNRPKLGVGSPSSARSSSRSRAPPSRASRARPGAAASAGRRASALGLVALRSEPPLLRGSRRELLYCSTSASGATVDFGIGWRLRLDLFAEQRHARLRRRGRERHIAGRRPRRLRRPLSTFRSAAASPSRPARAGPRSTPTSPGAGYELTEILGTLASGSRPAAPGTDRAGEPRGFPAQRWISH